MALDPTGMLELVSKMSPESWNGGIGYPHRGTGTHDGTGFGPEKFPNSRQVKLMLEDKSGNCKQAAFDQKSWSNQFTYT